MVVAAAVVVEVVVDASGVLPAAAPLAAAVAANLSGLLTVSTASLMGHMVGFVFVRTL